MKRKTLRRNIIMVIDMYTYVLALRRAKREREDRYMQLYVYMYTIEGEVILYPRERNIRERGWIGNQYMWPHLGILYTTKY